MTNRFVAAMAFAALVISVLSLFVALNATTEEETPQTGDMSPSTTAPLGDDTPSASAAATTTTTRSPAVVAQTTIPVPATTAPPPTISVPPTSEPLPGTPAEFGPAAGTSLGLVGVSHDDFLNVRDVPNGSVVATLSLRIAPGDPANSKLQVRDPAAENSIATLSLDGITATGRTRDLATSTWHEIQAGPVIGWASSKYLAPLTPSVRLDMTAQVQSAVGSTPTAPTLTELANMVAAAFASDEPPSRIRVTAAPRAIDGLAEVTVDVVGLPDDSVRGYRLLISADPAGDWRADNVDTAGGPFTLRNVMATPLCYSHRGTGDNGLCN
ncbi:hypothetical protein [Candidatus Poriferisodalis sp.]|uniref:hypothetical protein n=1 Tax=Candidatus Poriferisodalis sp. TaxID=3101277 RepID=UPI003B019994